MRDPIKRFVAFPVVTVIVAGLAMFAGTTGLAASRQAEIIEQVLLKVNGDILTKTELETRQVTALRQTGKLTPSSRPTDAELRVMLDEVTPRILVGYVEELLLQQRAKELGYKLTDEQFKATVDGLKKDNKLETDEALTAALEQEGMTMDDLRKMLERRNASGFVQQREVVDHLSMTDDETRRYYDAHTAEFTTAPVVTLREVLVAAPAGTPDADARAKADGIRRRATAGEDFATLAGDLSEAPSRANAGLLGPLNLTDIADDIRKVVEPMKAGEVSQVVRTAAGFQIFKVDALTPKEVLPYEQARDAISERLYRTKRTDALTKYMEKLRSEAIIEWKIADLKKAYEEGLKMGPLPDAP